MLLFQQPNSGYVSSFGVPSCWFFKSLWFGPTFYLCEYICSYLSLIKIFKSNSVKKWHFCVSLALQNEQNSSKFKFEKKFNHYFNILYWTKFRYWLFLLIFNAFWHLQPAHSDLCSHLYAIKMLQFTLELASTANFWYVSFLGYHDVVFQKVQVIPHIFHIYHFFIRPTQKKL